MKKVPQLGTTVRLGGMRVTLSELRKKDVVCIGDGRVIGRVQDLEFDTAGGHVRALIIPGCSCLSSLWHGEKSVTVISWQQIACIGDDVVLVTAAKCQNV